MIPFFRRVRKKMADDNKPLKYMRYAIGEIALVVIGILIALQINNWKEDQQERSREIAILKQLNTEFISNLNQLDEKIASKTEVMNSVIKLLSYIDHPITRNKDSIDDLLGRTMPFSTFDPIVNDLASSGNLRLIKNERLKQILSFWTSEIKDVQEDEGNWKHYRNDTYVPFLVKYYQLRTVRNKAIKSKVLYKYRIDENDTSESKIKTDIGMTKHPEDFNSLLDQPDFEDHLIRAFATNSFAKDQSLSLRKRIVEILDLLNKEIND